ncbi:MAG: methyltransferase domain-containing protein [Hyphomicrobiaceae bacterium]|jgi:SAM-dependent methyltransferase
MPGDVNIFDRDLVAWRRNRAAETLPLHDFLLARAADDLMDRLQVVRRTFPVVLDLGAHHGLLARRVRELPGTETVIAMERAERLLRQCPAPQLLADEELVPIRDGAVDLVVSALALQFVNDLPGTLVQVHRALKPDGLFLAALLGGRTLFELAQSFLLAEAEVEGGTSPRVAPFADVRELGALLQRARFALPVADVDTVTVTYADPLALMRDLRAMGATNMLAARRRRPLRRATLQRAIETYVRRFGSADGRIPATFEIVTLTGWTPHESQPKALAPGSARQRLADALRTTERPTGDTTPNRKR